MTKRTYLVEVTVDDPDEGDSVDVWRAIGGALTDAGFDDVLYGESMPLEDGEG
jgi:hypothetical protein